MAKSQVSRVRQVAELKFAAEFAPAIYGGYLKKDNSANQKNVTANLFSAITPPVVVKIGDIPSHPTTGGKRPLVPVASSASARVKTC